MAVPGPLLRKLEDITDLEIELLQRARRLAEVYSVNAGAQQNDVERFYTLMRERLDALPT